MPKISGMPVKAKIFVGLVVALGIATLCRGVWPWANGNLVRFGLYLLITMVASGCKVSLPGIKGTMSFYFLCVLVNVAELRLPETFAIVAAAVIWQCYWHARKRPKLVQVAFNLGSNFIAASLAYGTFHSALWTTLSVGTPIRLAGTAVIFFFANTFPVAAVIALTERKKIRELWNASYFWSFPYYLLGASIAGFFNWLSLRIGWEAALLLVPVVTILFRSYRLYVGQLEYAEEVASLHFRTIEALASAIEAKDHITHDHVQRVQIYALEVGRELGLGKDELDALKAASLLHDIGKLAVPDHIISKPGKLTPEEFQKMKVHPTVGAEILERVKFPYPVAPIVRAHHEKWDGTGYPVGLKGDEIPIGARILSAVDFLDALASDRQYRKAYPLEKAVSMLAAQSGISFDPKVVEVLQRRYIELEAMARRTQPIDLPALSIDVTVERGAAPDAGFDEESAPATMAVRLTGTASGPATSLSSVAAVRQELETLFEMALDSGNSLTLPEPLPVLAMRLKQLVPFDTFSIYMLCDGKLIPEYVVGEDRALFSSLEIPLGQGVSGWVAENRKPIVNGNASFEAAYLKNPAVRVTVNSALAVPLEDYSGVLGVLTLYRVEPSAFTRDQLRIVQAITSKLGVPLRTALTYRQSNPSDDTDTLTGLPNSRSLFIHLDTELARSEQTHEALALVVCELDDFKEVNDRFGYSAGNRVLQLIAATLKDCCGEHDYAARIGGDEFVVVIPGLWGKPLEDRLLEIQRLVELACAQVCGQQRVTVSIGQALLGRDGNSAEKLLEVADQRMADNKRARKAALWVQPDVEAIREFAQAG